MRLGAAELSLVENRGVRSVRAEGRETDPGAPRSAWAGDPCHLVELVGSSIFVFGNGRAKEYKALADPSIP